VLLAIVLAGGRPAWIGIVLGLLALVYLGHIALTGESDLTEVGLAGTALLITGELGQWSLDSRLPGRYDAALHLARAGGLAALALLGLGTVVLAQLAAGLPIDGGIAAVAVATAATVALLGLVSGVALRRFGSPAESSRDDGS
jgi:hypothetical protein